MRILESHRVHFATFQLEGRARRWWKSYLLGRPADSPPMTWDKFTHIFLDRFIPPSQREELRFQFEQLQQGQMSVTNYEARFSKLSRHALMILPTDAERAQRCALSGGRGQFVRGQTSRPPYPAPMPPLGAPVWPYFSAMPESFYRPPAIHGSSSGSSAVDMTNFEIILGMDWLSPYHVVLDFHAKTVTLAMLELPRLEWKGLSVSASNQVISFLKARHMVEKGCLAYLAYGRDTTAETPAINSLPVVWEFSDVFPSDLPGMPPDHDIDFRIDLAPDTQLISITPYRMAPKELKELKE
ncbi:uncharacterized protein [Nicotiana tomentosiformis]|uniref:uncharacterized protein n=1 Tax=Nicotiana tomentosiformis TaxID=4098 RepID=UPI00388CCAC3